MRLWTIHPKYLDTSGFNACWREALLAQAVLAGQTTGYKNHPQLDRFYQHSEPLKAIGKYLLELWYESQRRGWHHQFNKILYPTDFVDTISVSAGQVEFEYGWLKEKIFKRAGVIISDIEHVEHHKLFVVVDGSNIEPWEKGTLNWFLLAGIDKVQVDMIEFDKLSIDEAQHEYQKLFFTFKQEFGMADEDAAKAVSIATGICPYCWEEQRGCQCWNDE